MKKLCSSMLLIFGLVFSIIPQRTLAYDYIDPFEEDFEFEMTLDEDYFGEDSTPSLPGNDCQTDTTEPAVTTSVATNPAPQTVTTTAVVSKPAATTVKPVTLNPSTVTSVVATVPQNYATTSTTCMSMVGDTPSSTHALTFSTVPPITQEPTLPTEAEATTSYADEPESPSNATTTVTQPPQHAPKKLLIFCALSAGECSEGLWVTVKTQAKQEMDSIGYVEASVLKYDSQNQIAERIPLKDYILNSEKIFEYEFSVPVEKGFSYGVELKHYVSFGGKVKTLSNISNTVYFSGENQDDNNIPDEEIPSPTFQQTTALNNSISTAIPQTTASANKPFKPAVTWKPVFTLPSANNLAHHAQNPASKPVIHKQSNTPKPIHKNQTSTATAKPETAPPKTGVSGIGFEAAVFTAGIGIMLFSSRKIKLLRK